MLLNLAFEFLAAAIDGSQVIIGELTPLLLDLAFDLLPVSFNTIPVHDILLHRFWLGRRGKRCDEIAAPPGAAALRKQRGAASRRIWSRSSSVQLSRQVTCDFHAGYGFLDLWFQPFVHYAFPFLLRA